MGICKLNLVNSKAVISFTQVFISYVQKQFEYIDAGQIK